MHIGVPGVISHLGASAVGGWLGGIVAPGIGHVAGIVLGLLASYKSGRFVRHWQTDKGLLQIALKRAGKLEGGSGNIKQFAALSIAESVKHTKTQIGLIGNILGKEISSIPPSKDKSAPIKDFLGDESNGLSKQQQLDKVIKKITSVTDEQWNQHKQNILSVYSHPEYSKILPSLSASLDAKRNILLQAVPRKESAQQPFQKVKEIGYDKEQVMEFEDVLRLANDPFEIYNDLKNGTISERKVGIVAAIYPEVIRGIREEAFRECYNKELPYQSRLITSIMLGENIDQSLNNISQLQAGYSSLPIPPTSSSSSSSVAAKQTSSRSAGSLPSYATSFQQTLAKTPK